MARRLAVVPDYFLTPRWMFAAAHEHSWSAEAIVTFVVLCSAADADGLVTSSVAALARECGIHRTTVMRHITTFIDSGAVVDLGRESPRSPRHLRISQVKPLAPGAIAFSTRRATRDGSGWIAVP